jgi:hypothetical protein
MIARLVVTLVASIAITGCTGAQGAVAPSTATAPQTTAEPPTATAPVTAPTPTAAQVVGPADYQTWVEIQGFGGSSGVRQVLKGANWINDHPAEGSAFDIGLDMRVADSLAEWLDAHSAKPCWADYHATMRTLLDRIHDGYSAAYDARAAGAAVPLHVASELVAASQTAFDLPAPAGC